MSPAETITAQRGDMVDQLVSRRRGRTAGLVEQALDSNPGLAARGVLLDAGATFILPAAPASAPTRETIKLWD